MEMSRGSVRKDKHHRSEEGLEIGREDDRSVKHSWVMSRTDETGFPGPLELGCLVSNNVQALSKAFPGGCIIHCLFLV